MPAIHCTYHWWQILVTCSIFFPVSTHSVDISEIETDYFLTKLMDKYGNGDEIPFEGLEHLLHGLGLGGRLVFDHTVVCHKADDQFIPLHSGHNHSWPDAVYVPYNTDCVNQTSGHTHSGYEHVRQHHQHVHGHNHNHEHSHNHKDRQHSHGHEHSRQQHNHTHSHDMQEEAQDLDHVNNHKHHNHDHSSYDHSGHDHNHNPDNTDRNIKTKVDDKHIHLPQDRTPSDKTDTDRKQDTPDDRTTNTRRKGRGRHTYRQRTSRRKQKGDNDNSRSTSTTSTATARPTTTTTTVRPTTKPTVDMSSTSLQTTPDVSKHTTKVTERSSTQSVLSNRQTEHLEISTIGYKRSKDKDKRGGPKQRRKRPSSRNEEHKDVDTVTEDPIDTVENTNSKDLTHSIEKRHISYEKCMSVADILILLDVGPSTTLSRQQFMELCPALIYQIDSDACHQHHEIHIHASGGQDHENHVHGTHGHSHGHGNSVTEVGTSSGKFGLHDVPGKVWGYSSLAVVIISLVGLLGVAVIPIMQKLFYQQLLQFLVALAVGALSGDALLHLLPHALAGGHGEGDGGHSHEEEGHGHDTSGIYKCLCGLMGIYVFYIMERCLVILSTFRKNRKKTEPKPDDKTIEVQVNKASEDEKLMQLQPSSSAHHDEEHTPHRHGHGHSHSMDGAPDSVMAVAWMVIMGDGIHNFCDGLAIGAAFVSSITGGFSTSIAVFCHELPHEIGDFAMLLKSGMTVKQAIFYNCVSSILCFVGMLLGVAIGNMAGASLWVFVVVAGMFLYIALVDMLPVLTENPVDKTKDAFIELFLQIVGMMIGAGIMLVIALYEEKLQTILD